jgi:hypothetical protein
MSCFGQSGSSYRFAGHSVTSGDGSSSGRGSVLAAFLRLTGYGRDSPGRAVITPGTCPQVVPATTTPATSPATRAGCPRGTRPRGQAAPGVGEDQDDDATAGKAAASGLGEKCAPQAPAWNGGGLPEPVKGASRRCAMGYAHP